MVRRDIYSLKAALAAAAFGVPMAFVTPSAHAQSMAAKDAAQCESLTALDLKDVRIHTATPVSPAPVWNSPTGPDVNQRTEVRVPFCRVQGIIEKEIEFELWLPQASAWNGRFLGAGNGGDAGFIAYKDLGRGVARGFAAASTNTGHRLSNQDWAAGRPDRMENYGHRAHHLLAVHAKALVARFYERPIRFAYFSGCSGGGMQAMNEAQRYPGDYDGVMAGASGFSVAPISVRFLYGALLDRDSPQGALKPADWDRVERAVLDQCDQLDGLKDGLLTDPRQCRFDPGSVPGLSAAQAQRVRDFYAPLRTKDGRQLYPGLAPGARFMPQGRQIDIATRTFSQWVYDDPKWQPSMFEPGKDLIAAEDRVAGLRFKSPDLEPLERRGAKLITYVGWLDGIVPPEANIEYRDDVVRLMGREKTDSFFRLFMAPGVLHCSGGPGPDSFGQAGRGDPPVSDPEHDMLSALMRWVEEGKAPDKIIASKVSADGRVQMTRPLCPYPQAARYKGAGDPNKAESFECRAP